LLSERNIKTYSAVVGVPPEVTDLDLALESWKKVYLPLVLK
jgi:hypothetical protein